MTATASVLSELCSLLRSLKELETRGLRPSTYRANRGLLLQRINTLRGKAGLTEDQTVVRVHRRGKNPEADSRPEIATEYNGRLFVPHNGRWWMLSKGESGWHSINVGISDPEITARIDERAGYTPSFLKGVVNGRQVSRMELSHITDTEWRTAGLDLGIPECEIEEFVRGCHKGFAEGRRGK